jgi:hypothetical protein
MKPSRRRDAFSTAVAFACGDPGAAPAERPRPNVVFRHVGRSWQAGDLVLRRGIPDGRAATSLDLQAGLSVTVPAADEPRMKEAQ